jgi:hypothetical protein
MSSQALSCDEKSCHLPAKHFYITIPSEKVIDQMLGIMQHLPGLSMPREEVGKPSLSKCCWKHQRKFLMPGVRELSRQEFLGHCLVEELMNT